MSEKNSTARKIHMKTSIIPENSNIHDIFKNSQITQTQKSLSSGGIDEISGAIELQHDIKKEEIIEKESQAFSVHNNVMISHKRVMQNKINQVAQDMEVEENDMQKLLMSYSGFMKLTNEIEKQKQQQSTSQNPYGVDLEKQAIEEFVRRKTEENVTISNQNANNSKKNKTSQNSRKNASMIRKRKKNKNKKGGNTFAKATGGIAAAMTGLYMFT